MADVKWIKIVTDIFDDEKILLIESIPEADAIIVIWFKLLTLAGKINNGGVLMFNEKLPYTDEMLATIFRRPVNTVRLAIKTFEQFGMVETINNTITIPNWSKHQTLDQLEERKEYMKNYMREYREKQKQLAEGKVNSKVNSKANVNSLEEEVDIEVEEEVEEDTTTANKYQIIIDTWNELGLGNIRSIQSNRLKMVQARVNEYSLEEVVQAIKNISNSSFLKGQNNRNWIITFDWFIKPNNFIKVLEGNYLDKGANNGEYYKSNNGNIQENERIKPDYSHIGFKGTGKIDESDVF